MNTAISHEAECQQIARAVQCSPGGMPLEKSVRNAMQSRFRQDLTSVRIHTGEQAAALASRLRARAFTIGEQVVFAADAFQPHDRNGRKLLAHELAHVIQQRNQPFNRDCAHLGPANDLWEKEAQLAADRIDTTAALPRLTPDASGAIRRVIELDVNSAGIDIAFGTAKASISLHDQPNQQDAAFHLTRGFNTVTLNPNDSEVGDPINFTGHAKLKASEAELKASRFGFIQVVKVFPLTFVYQGRKPDEGHVVVDLGVIMGDDFILDADSRAANRAFLPFYRTANEPVLLDGEVAVSMRDHPFFKIPLKTMNFSTGFDNFLMAVEGGFDFFSTCCFRDPSKKLIPLAHAHWQVVHSRRFIWKNGSVQESLDNSRLTPDFTEKGPPKDKKALAKTIGGQLSPIGNDVFRAAILQVGDRSSRNRFERPGTHTSSPPNFFS